MTYQQVTLAIDGAAELAARSAVDAHGADVPPAQVAWDFLQDSIYGSGEIERPAALPDVLTPQFRLDYDRHVRMILTAGKPFETENTLTPGDLAEIEALQRLALVELGNHPARRGK